MSHDNYIVVGKVLTTHGIKGYLTIKSFTAIPSDIFKYDIYIRLNNNYLNIKIDDYKFMPKKTIMKIKNINLIEDCQDYIGLDLLVLKKDLPKTDSDEYYWYELIGSNVINSDGIELGKVIEIFTSGENEVLVIKNKSDDKEIFIPFLKNTIINFEDKKLTVRWDDEL